MFNQNRTKFLLDLLTFTAFLIAMDPRSSGIAIHEWLTIALAGTIVVHLLLNWDWIAQVTARIFSKGLNGSRVNYILNWLLFFDGILIMLSGILISESVVPAFGIVLPSRNAWRELHDLSANFALVLMGLHLALHWNWLVTTFKRLFARGGISTANSVTERKDAQA